MDTRKLTLSGLLLAAALALTAAESLMLPSFLPLGVKLGLASIAVMVALILCGARYALAITLLKSVFVLATRGATAFVMSLCGGVSAFLVMWLCLIIARKSPSCIALSISGAVAHNLGQLLAAGLLVGGLAGAYAAYAPVLILCGILCGAATGTALRLLLPVAKRF